MKIGFLFFFTLFVSYKIAAQYNPTIRSARPGSTSGAFTIGQNVFQIQNGIVFQQTRLNEEGKKNNVLRNGTVLRLGILEKLEIQGTFTLRKDWLSIDSFTGKRSGISNTQIGARYNIRQPNKAAPAMSIQARVLLRAQSEDFRREKTGLALVLTTGQKIGQAFGINSNIGMRWPGNGKSDLFYALKFSYRLAPKLVVMVDGFGLVTDFSINYNTGFFYVVNKDFKIDLSTGWLGSNNKKDWSISTGISWRTDWRK